MSAYYNEIDPYAAQWLRNLIAAGLIATGEVDTRSIVDVRPDDVRGFVQCHFFAGIAGWSYACRLAGWPDDRPIWTGSCPCQPFSVAGKGLGAADERHLWPAFFALIRACRPAVVMGEQVAAAVGKDWLDGVCADLENIGYAVGAAVIPACAVDAPHRRDRLWFVADAAGARQRNHEDPRAACGGENTCDREARKANGFLEPERDCRGPVGDAHAQGSPILSGVSRDARAEQPAAERASRRSAWAGAEWLGGADGKARRVEPSIRLLAHGVPARVGQLRAYGNAIVPQVAAEVIGAYLECRP